MNEARTQEEKIQLLEEERLRLADIVRFESRRQAILDRIDSLERDATRILDELAFLDKEVVVIG
jgi:Tfp pilus assembly protein PilN